MELVVHFFISSRQNLVPVRLQWVTNHWDFSANELFHSNHFTSLEAYDSAKIGIGFLIDIVISVHSLRGAE